MIESICFFCGNPSNMIWETSPCCMKCFYEKIGRVYPNALSLPTTKLVETPALDNQSCDGGTNNGN